MTNPQITTIEPSKSKTWVAIVGGLLTVLVPMLLSVSEFLPAPWPGVIGGVVAILTAVGVYKAPYKPEGTSVVATSDLREIATPTLPVSPSPSTGGEYTNPWK